MEEAKATHNSPLYQLLHDCWVPVQNRKTTLYHLSSFHSYLSLSMEVNEAAGEGCRTPRHSGCRIPAALECPPAPKKKPFQGNNKKQEMPKNGYFQPPDLEVLFAIPSRREACA